MKYTLTVKADVNDGDIRTNQTAIDQSEVDNVTRLFNLLEKSRFGHGVWDVEDGVYSSMWGKYQDKMTREEFDYLCSIIPTCEYGYTRSVDSVTLTPISEVITII